MTDLTRQDVALAEAITSAKNAGKLPTAPTGTEDDLDKLLNRLKAQGADMPFSLDPKDLEGIEEDVNISSFLDPDTGQVRITPVAHKCMVLHMQGFSFVQIARMLGCSSATVSQHLRSEIVQRRIAAMMAHVEKELEGMQLLALRRLHLLLTSGDGAIEMQAIKLVLATKLKSLSGEGEKTAEDTVRDIMATLERKMSTPDGELVQTAQVRVIDSSSRRRIIDATPVGEEDEKEKVLGKRSA